MTYNELLNQKEWWSKCNEILQRDHFTCKDCGSVGFHNGGSFIKLDHIEELDSILKGWLFNGTIFSKFWSNIPYNTPYPISNIPFQAECCDEDLTVYDLNLFNTRNSLFKDIWSTPEKIIAVSKEKIEYLDAIAYSFSGMSKNINSHEALGSAYLFEFPCDISDEIYVNIEYSLPFKIGEVRYDRNIINITYQNRVLSLRYSTWDFKMKGLNIHHTYYIKGRKPWEYEGEALVTLCENCHKKRHETSHVPYYDNEKHLIGHFVPCDRCGGSGYLPQYSHVEHGICFKCGGEGVVIND